MFQYIPISFGVAVATDVTQAFNEYCANGNGAHFAHIWVRRPLKPLYPQSTPYKPPLTLLLIQLTIIRSISVVMAFIRLLHFYKRLRSELTPHHVVSKLVAIKGIVFLSFLQTIIFTILNSTGAAKPTAKLSYYDIYYGIPSILICVEMVLFSLFNFHAYTSRPYHISSSTYLEGSGSGSAGKGGYLGTIKALIMAANPTEIISGLVHAVRNVISIVGGDGSRGPYADDGVGLQPLGSGELQRPGQFGGHTQIQAYPPQGMAGTGYPQQGLQPYPGYEGRGMGV